MPLTPMPLASCQVMTRSGSPARMDDLRWVAAPDAATVLVMHPDEVDEVGCIGSAWGHTCLRPEACSPPQWHLAAAPVVRAAHVPAATVILTSTQTAALPMFTSRSAQGSTSQPTTSLPTHLQAAAASQKAATIAALKAAGGCSNQSIIIQAGGTHAKDFNAADVAVAEVAGAASGQAAVVVVLNRERISQLMAQCTFQPRLSGVVGDLLMQSSEGAEFYSQVC
jgi:hypothetical protein